MIPEVITSGGTGDAVMMFENASGNTWGHGIDLTNNNYVIAYNSTSDPSLTADGKVEITSGGDVLIADTTNSVYNDTSGGGINLKANGQIVNKKEPPVQQTL